MDLNSRRTIPPPSTVSIDLARILGVIASKSYDEYVHIELCLVCLGVALILFEAIRNEIVIDTPLN